MPVDTASAARETGQLNDGIVFEQDRVQAGLLSNAGIVFEQDYCSSSWNSSVGTCRYVRQCEGQAGSGVRQVGAAHREPEFVRDFTKFFRLRSPVGTTSCIGDSRQIYSSGIPCW